MKSYLFLLLLVFIACNIEEKTDEIILKDFVQDLLIKIADIFKECGVENIDCIIAEMTNLNYELTPEQVKDFENFRDSPCQNDCVNIFSDVIKDGLITEEFCKNLLCYSL